MDMLLHETLRDKILRSFADEGRAWLERLPGLPEEFVRQTKSLLELMG